MITKIIDAINRYVEKRMTPAGPDCQTCGGELFFSGTRWSHRNPQDHRAEPKWREHV